MFANKETSWDCVPFCVLSAEEIVSIAEWDIMYRSLLPLEGNIIPVYSVSGKQKAR